MSCRWWPSTIHRPPDEERRSCGVGRMHHTKRRRALRESERASSMLQAKAWMGAV